MQDLSSQATQLVVKELGVRLLMVSRVYCGELLERRFGVFIVNLQEESLCVK